MSFEAHDVRRQNEMQPVRSQQVAVLVNPNAISLNPNAVYDTLKASLLQ